MGTFLSLFDNNSSPAVKGRHMSNNYNWQMSPRVNDHFAPPTPIPSHWNEYYRHRNYDFDEDEVDDTFLGWRGRMAVFLFLMMGVAAAIMFAVDTYQKANDIKQIDNWPGGDYFDVIIELNEKDEYCSVNEKFGEDRRTPKGFEKDMASISGEMGKYHISIRDLERMYDLYSANNSDYYRVIQWVAEADSRCPNDRNVSFEEDNPANMGFFIRTWDRIFGEGVVRASRRVPKIETLFAISNICVSEKSYLNYYTGFSVSSATYWLASWFVDLSAIAEILTWLFVGLLVTVALGLV